jgi:hypothetical protein
MIIRINHHALQLKNKQTHDSFIAIKKQFAG